MPPSAWAKLSKIVACLFRGMPIPVSCTAKRSETSRGVRSTMATETPTQPARVNLSALESRFCSTWRRRSASKTTKRGTFGPTSIQNSSPLAAARVRVPAAMSASQARRSAARGSSSIRPASIFAWSSRPLISASSVSDSLRIVRDVPRASSSDEARAASSAKPTMQLSGVRISCETVETNSDFIRLAASAASFARDRSSCARRSAETSTAMQEIAGAPRQATGVDVRWIHFTVPEASSSRHSSGPAEPRPATSAA